MQEDRVRIRVTFNIFLDSAQFVTDLNTNVLTVEVLKCRLDEDQVTCMENKNLPLILSLLLATKSNLIRGMDSTIKAVCPLKLFKGRTVKKPTISSLYLNVETQGTVSAL